MSTCNMEKVKSYLLAASGRKSSRVAPWTDDVASENFTLPKYEIEVLNNAKKQNTIVCLHSTTSKSFLMINVIREYFHGINKKIEDGGQRIVCLTMDQNPVDMAETIHRHLPVDIGSFGIEHGVLLWKKEQWNQEMQTRSILVMHPTVFYELLNRNYIEFSQIKLLILDECHQAIRDHAYGSIIKQYKQQCTDEPRLFSITTALLKNYCTPIQLQERIENLKTLFCSSVFTATDLICRQTNRFAKIPSETIIVCEPKSDRQPAITTEIVQELHDALSYLDKLEHSNNHSVPSTDDNPSSLTIPRQVLHECLRLVDKLGIWALLRSSLPIITQLERLSNMASNQIDGHHQLHSGTNTTATVLSLSSPKAYSLFLDWTCTLLRLWRCRIKTVLDSLDSKTLIEQYTTPKLRSLFDILKRFQSNATSINTHRWSALVFVDRKQETAVLNAILKDAAKRFDDFSFIRPNFLIGYSTVTPSNTNNDDTQQIQPMDSRKQEEVMRKFRLGENNLIVALSSLEELNDLPDCSLVVRFNVPTSYRSYIQSKGKARSQSPHFFMLVEKNEYDEFLKNVNCFKGIEQVLAKNFYETNSEQVEHNDTDQFPNAIEVINRYCARLPCDALTSLVPINEIKTLPNNHYQCILSLPVNSPARKTIIGPSRPTLKQAKLIAAKRLCEHLLQAETREQFYLKHSVIDEEDIAEWGNYSEPKPKPGSMQRKQLYSRAIIPEPLVPTKETCSSMDYFIYAISAELTTPLTAPSSLDTSQNLKIVTSYTNDTNPYCLGFVSANYLLEIPSFALFSRAGEETYNLQLIMKNIRFTEDDYRILQTVHYYIFSGILGFDRPLVNFNPEQAKCHLMCILLKKDPLSNCGYSIDWSLTKAIITFIQTINLHKYTMENPYVFNASDFNDTRIVLPSYRRSTQPQYYMVNSIDINKNPQSSFPSISSIYDTFSSYYEIKYELHLTNKTQPLLCVSHTSHRLNQLIPRYMNFKMLKSLTSRSRGGGGSNPNANKQQNGTTSHHHHQHQGVFLIPELVIIHPIPAQLWQGIIALPSILYRIQCLILVEQLRRDIARETGVGIAWAPDEGLFEKLGFDWDEKKESQFSALLDNDTCYDQEPLDPNWNFEISVWNGEATQNWTNNDAWNEAKNGCIMFNAADFGPNDYGESDESEDGENGSLHKQNFDLDDDMDDEEEFYDPPPEQKQDVKQPKNLHNESFNKQQELSTNYQIDLSRLGEDLKAKSKKFLSKLISNSQPTPSSAANQDDNDVFILPSLGLTEKHSTVEQSYWLRNVRIETQPSAIFFVQKEEQKVPSDVIDREQQIPIQETLVQTTIAKIVDTPILKQKVLHFEPDDYTKRLLNIDDASDSDDSEYKDSVNNYNNSTITTTGITDSEWMKPNSQGGIINDYCDPLGINLDFEYVPESHPGPSPALLLQALTLSNAGDGFDLERLETVGDSFLKQAVTVYIYCTYPKVHEGKLSFFRSKIVSNYNLYKLGKRNGFGEYLISCKFEPYENWLPPLFVSGLPTEYGMLSTSGVEMWTKSDTTTNIDWIELQERREQRRLAKLNSSTIRNAPADKNSPIPIPTTPSTLTMFGSSTVSPQQHGHWTPSFDRRSQHMVSDKSIADTVEALIGAYLIASGPKAALRFMAWLGVRIFPKIRLEDGTELTGELPKPSSPVDYSIPDTRTKILSYEDNFDCFEQAIGYRFHERAYLIQAFTHASYSYNTITDCYQRLEFLGDAVLDYVITRYLYEHPKRHSPGELTDLRSALVNNNIFAYIAVKYDYHKYFRCHSNELFLLIDKFVNTQKEKWWGFDECNLDDDENDEFFYYDFLTTNNESNYNCYYDDDVTNSTAATVANGEQPQSSLTNINNTNEDDEQLLTEHDEWEETEVPKCLGDIFESVAGAIFLDSNKSFNSVWKVYYRMMKPFIEKFTAKVPKSPIRELLELEPETVKFEKPERLLDGRIRVTVEIIGKGRFKGVGRNYRIAKNASAKCALKNLRRLD
ncbi:unnamed protein product [Didymodactylos carnosus]|uniref:Dicer-1 n=1 Tax=Didymodactylos carnosus TaxID=1234261 RepID=A0A813QIV0_9BILA|nr:unnamed protein product [Didymodactylos carnosus]CAF0768289.1 unnamed protein product [Didymodactylos carnosus]CAF3514585.1 unnamed protein product [Didymodactylos carnosus]CAF3550103.1 unnamed protein product [Didymodactylos carnosus]